jgi:hypothetical protein
MNGAARVMSEDTPSNYAIADDPSDDVIAAFISYASPDRERAHAIAATLEERGLRCWIAPRDVRPGHEYGAEIIHGIERSRCLVLVLSEAANRSTFVRREVVSAVNRQKPIFPIRVEEVLPSRSLELYVSSTHWIDAWSGALVDHVRRLAADLGNEQLIAEGRDRARRIVRRRRRVPRWIGIAAALVAIAITVFAINRLMSPAARTADDAGATPTPTPAVIEVFEDGPGGMHAAFRKRLKDLRVNLDAITRNDVTFEIRADELGVRLKPELHIKARPELVKIFESFKGTVQLDGGESKSFATAFMKPYFRDHADLANARKLTLSFESQFQMTGLDKTIGPFTYEVNFEPAIRALWKQAALVEPEKKKWATLSLRSWEPGWEFGSLSNYLPAVKQVFAGTSPDKLDVTIKIDDPSQGFPDKLERDELRKAYQRKYIPVPDDARSIYVQLEFFDGTRSEVVRFDWPKDWNPPPPRPGQKRRT